MDEKVITLFCLFFIITPTYAQHFVKGTVKDKKHYFPLPGVNVFIKGTSIGTITNGDGKFELNVPKDTLIITVSYIGYQSQEIPLPQKDPVEVLLKEDCIVDFFYRRHIGVDMYSGLLYAPAGGLVEFFYPFLFFPGRFDPAFQFLIGYQTNLNGNKQILAQLGLNELIKNCDYNSDLNFQYNAIQLAGKNITFNTYKVEARTDFDHLVFRGTILFAGIGYGEYKKENNWKQGYGFELGAGKHIGRPVYATMYGKATAWSNFWQIQGGIEKRIRKVDITLSTNAFQNYFEVNLRAGIDINF